MTARIVEARRMFKKFPLGFTSFCLFLLTGCLEFEQQTLTCRYDAKSDTLRIFQAYQGIFGGDKPDGLSAQEREQLQSVLTTQRTFFFANWIAEYDRTKVRESLDEMKKPETQKDSKRDPASIARLESFLKLLLDNVRVENGDFYLDDKGKLCGVQRVTVTHFSKLVATANGPIRDFVKSEMDKEHVSAEERALFLKFAEQPSPCFVLEGNQLCLRLPITQVEYRKTFEQDPAVAKALDVFKQAGGQVSFADNEMKWSLGMASDQGTTLSLSVAQKPYVANASNAVKSLAAIREKLDITAAAKEFVSGTNPEKKPAKP